MGRLKPREERVPLRVRARLRTDDGWYDATIANASSRGILLRSPVALPRQTFIEVRRHDQVIVGRVVWSEGLQCGVRTQDDIDIGSLVETRPLPAAPGQDRRRHSREAARPAAPARRARSHEESRLRARIFDFSALVLVVVALAVALADGAQAVLRDGLDPVAVALAG